MPKKKDGGGGGPKPGELPVTYADMVTLLLTFFVFLMSMAQFDEAKLEDIFMHMALSFGFKGDASAGMLTAGSSFSKEKALLAGGSQLLETKKDPKNTMKGGAARPGEGSPTTTKTTRQTKGAFQVSQQAVQQFEQVVEGLGDMPGVDARLTSQGLKIDLQEGFARFASGSDQLPPEALPKLRELIATELQPLIDDGFEISVLGHTDDVPLGAATGARFTDNRGLAAARANTVLRIFESLGVNPRQVSAAGYGSHRPKADNDSADGRAQNRRIEVLVKYKEFSATDWGEDY